MDISNNIDLNDAISYCYNQPTITTSGSLQSTSYVTTNSLAYTNGTINWTCDGSVESSLKIIFSSTDLSEMTIRALLADPNIKDRVPMESVAKQNLSFQFIKDFYTKLPKDILYTYQKLIPIEFIDENMSDSNTRCAITAICANQKLTVEFIEKHKALIDWEALASNRYIQFSLKLLEKYRNNFIKSSVLQVLTDNLSISDDLFDKFISECDLDDDINWAFISWRRNLSENTIYKFIDNLDFNSQILRDRKFENDEITCYRRIKFGY